MPNISIPAFQLDLSTYKAEILSAVARVIDSGQLVLGQQTREIEERWAMDHGRKFGIAVNSDTAALESVLQAIAGPRPVVLMPQTAFFACANIVLRLNGTVCLVDVDPTQGVMPSISQWEEAIWYLGLRGIQPNVAMLVYSGGQCSPNQVADIQNLQSKGLVTLEDAAHCHMGRYADGRFIGSEGDFATWSTYATKIITSGEGGMIVTDHAESADFMRNYRAYGRKATNDTFTECTSALGYNWRMTEFQAAILNVMWSHLPEIMAERQRVADIYNNFFPPSNQESHSPYYLVPTRGTPNLYRYTVMIPGMTFETNWMLIQYLKQFGITLQAKLNPLPLSMHSAYYGHPQVLSTPKRFPGAMKYCLEHICLPIYSKLPSSDAEFIAETVMGWYQQNRKLLRRG